MENIWINDNQNYIHTIVFTKNNIAKKKQANRVNTY